jgi:ADP-ribose pyrophosphatase YjhB (NUDIX family)
MHPIQQHILRQLALGQEVKFSQLKPKNVESNLFMYHLRKLMMQGMVAKTAGGYELSLEGCQYVDTTSLSTFGARIQPKIVTFIACQNEAGQWLLYKRKHHPYSGRVGFPYGKIHLGEGIQAAAKRELHEKTGLSADLVHTGDAYITTYQNDELLTQMFAHVFIGKHPKGELLERSDIGECFWDTIENPTDARFIPGFAQIYELLTTPRKERFFEEIICKE